LFLAGQFEIRPGGPAEVMEKVTALSLIPPAKEFHFDPASFQSRLGLLDPEGKSVLGQKEGKRVVKNYFHALGWRRFA